MSVATHSLWTSSGPASGGSRNRASSSGGAGEVAGAVAGAGNSSSSWSTCYRSAAGQPRVVRLYFYIHVNVLLYKKPPLRYIHTHGYTYATYPFSDGITTKPPRPQVTFSDLVQGLRPAEGKARYVRYLRKVQRQDRGRSSEKN